MKINLINICIGLASLLGFVLILISAYFLNKAIYGK